MINHKPETYNPNTAKNFNLHNPDVDYAKLGEQCLEQILLIDVYRALVGGKEEKPSSDNVKVQCCFHDDSHPSLSISLSKNLYHCFACGAKGNLIDFMKNYLKLEYKEAVDWLAEFGGIHIPQRVRPAPTKINPKVGRKDQNGNVHQYKVTTYDYGNGFWVDRFDLLDDHGQEIKGKKDFYQKYEKSQHQSKLYNKAKHPTFPVYRLAEAQAVSPIWLSITEGEKCADASWAVGIPAVTMVGILSKEEVVEQIKQIKGAGFTRLLYHVDADQPGKEKFQYFQEACEQVGGISLKYIDYKEHGGDKFDGADYIDKFGDKEYIQLVATAVRSADKPKNNVIQLQSRAKQDFDKLEELLIQLLEKSPKPAEIERFKAEFTSSPSEAKYIDALVREWQTQEEKQESKDALDSLLKDAKKSIKLEEIFPQFFANPITHHAHYLNVPEAAYIGPLLTAASRCMKTGTKVLLFPETNFHQPSILFFCLVAESGARKSPILKAVCEAPFGKLQQELDAPYKLALEEYEAELKEWEALDPKDRKGKEEPKPPKKPVRLKTTQNTAESYQRHANADPDFPYLIYNEELSGFFKNQNRYNRGSDKEEILQFYDGGSYTVDRKSGISADVPEFYLSILGSTQPKTLQNLVKQRGSESGEFARFLFTHMEQRKHNIPFPQRNGNTRVRRDFSPMLASLYERLMSLDATTYELDYDAQVAFWKAYDHLDSLSIKETHDKYKAALNKAAGQVGRLALIIHCVNSLLENPNEPPPKRIGVDTMQRAIKLMWFFLSQSRLVYGLQDDNTGGMAQHLFKIISLSQKLQEAGDEGWVKPRDVVRSYSGNKSIKTDIAKDWLNQLMSMGMGEIQTTAKSIKFRYIPNVDNVDSVETRIDIPIDIAKALYNKDFNQTVDNVDKNFNFCGDYPNYPDYPNLEKDEVGNNLKTNNQSTLSTNRHQMSEPLSGKPFNCREFVDTPSTQESTQEPTLELTQESTLEPTQESTQESTLESTLELTPELTLEPTQESTQESTLESTKINCSILCSDHLTEGCRVLHVKTNQAGKVVHLKRGDDGLCQSIKVLWADNSFGEPYPIDLEAI